MMKKIVEPDIPSVLQEGSINDEFESHRIDMMKYENDICTQDLSMHEFHGCVFHNITFTEDMESCLFADCLFDHCDFSNAHASQMVVRRAYFVNCRMTGTEFIRSTIEDMRVKGCHGMYINFSSSKMKRVSFQESNLSEGAFSMCKWSDVLFDDCDLRKAELVQSSLSKIDLSTCQIDGFVVRMEDLKGVIMSEDQALACTRFLGIEIKH